MSRPHIPPSEDASPLDPAQYDSFADEYERHAAQSPYNALYDRPAVLDLLGDVENQRVLDAACGPGFTLELLIERGARAVGCDASPGMIELARRRCGDAVELHVHSLDEPLDWIADESVDVVLCELAYHYLNDRGGFLCEAFRVIRPGGSVVISTHHPTADWVRLGGSYFHVANVKETWSTGWEITASRMPLSRLTEDFAAAGFLVERLVEPLPVPEMAGSHPATFAKLSAQPGFVLFKLIKPDGGTRDGAARGRLQASAAGGVRLGPDTVRAYARYALAQIDRQLDRFDDRSVNVRPHGAGTNSAAALVVHSCAAAVYWFEHIGLGRHLDRDRGAEFTAEADIAELRALVATTNARLDAVIGEFDAGPTALDHELRVFSPDGDTSDGSVVLHALQELFQHLGHLELTADAVGRPRA